MAEHTPGPWFLEYEGWIGSRTPDPVHIHWITQVISLPIPEALFNARLITAAPELLTACQDMLAWLLIYSNDKPFIFNRPYPPVTAMTKAEVAISKAIGKTS